LLSMLLLNFTLFGLFNFTAVLFVLMLPLFNRIDDRRLKNGILLPWVVSFLVIAITEPQASLLLGCLDGIMIIFVLANLPVSLDSPTESNASLNDKLFFGLVVGIFSLNASSNYLGYKNQGVLSMYSNLLVHEQRSNHLLVTRPLAWSNNLSELATLVSSDRDVHKILFENNGLIPIKLLKLEVAYWLKINSIPSITYRYQGIEKTLRTREDLVAFTKDLSFLDEHTLSLGYIFPSQTTCTW